MSARKPKRPIAQRTVEPTGNAKLDAYDAAVIALEHSRASLGCIKTMLDSDLWPNSWEAFEKIISNQIAEIDEAMVKAKVLDPGGGKYSATVPTA